MRTKKLIKIDDLKEHINTYLRHSAPQMKQARYALSELLENILNNTGNYRGFEYLNWTRNGGYHQWMADGEPDFPEMDNYLGDKSRRRYK